MDEAVSATRKCCRVIDSEIVILKFVEYGK